MTKQMKNHSTHIGKYDNIIQVITIQYQREHAHTEYLTHTHNIYISSSPSRAEIYLVVFFDDVDTDGHSCRSVTFVGRSYRSVAYDGRSYQSVVYECHSLVQALLAELVRYLVVVSHDFVLETALWGSQRSLPQSPQLSPTSLEVRLPPPWHVFGLGDNAYVYHPLVEPRKKLDQSFQLSCQGATLNQ